MAVLKCKMCGGELTVEEGASVAVCEYCGSKQTVPKADDEKKMKLFDRANRLRFNCEFDKAGEVYENIIEEFPEEAEAYWGNLLCKYGIEYVDDPATGDKIPTCHRSSFDSFMDDSDFELVMENSDTLSRAVYREQAKQIEEIRKQIIEVSGKEAPYDIFICYKETAEDGQRTIDSVIAQDVYDALTAKGYRVFFSRISLEDKLGTEYEPYIFAALNSAKVMLAFGTNYDYYNAVWVKNEWSRFLKLMAKDKTKALIPCYKDIDAYDMPKEFSKLQAQDMGKVGAVQDLLRGIDKLTGKDQASVSVQGNTAPEQTVIQQMVGGGPNAVALIDRGNMALEDGKFEEAKSFFDQALSIDSRNGEAYLGMAMASAKVTNVAAYGELIVHGFKTDKNHERARQYASAELVAMLESFEQKREKSFRERDEVIKEIISAEKEERTKKAFLDNEFNKKNEEYSATSIFKITQRREIKSELNSLRAQLNEINRALSMKHAQIVADKCGEKEFLYYYLFTSPSGITVEFGKYDSGNGIQPIIWRVLDDKDGRLLVTEKAIDCYPYNKNWAETTWETSSIRAWLNGEFFNKAFNEEEQKRIKESQISDEIDPTYGTMTGNETKDKVFLLSRNEARRYSPNIDELKCLATEYAIKQGVRVEKNEEIDKNMCEWWLRSPGKNNTKANFVYTFGGTSDIGRDVHWEMGVRPALWIDLKP